MKTYASKRWLIIVLLLASAMLVAEVSAISPPTVEWQKTFTYGEAETACAIQTMDGGYALGGTVELQQGTTCYFMKVDSSGNMQWNTTLGDMIGIVSAAVQTNNSEYALTGEHYGAIFLVKLDASGNIILNKTYTGMGDDFASSIFATSDGGYVLAGTMNAWTGAHLPSHPWLIRTDANGNVVWSQTYGTGDLQASTQTDDGGYAFLTTTFMGGVTLAKIAASGQMLWNQTYPHLQYLAGFYSLVQASDGGYAIATSVTINGSSHNGFWLAKTDDLGNMQWNRTYTGPGNDTNNQDLIRTGDEGYAMIGNTNMNSASPYAGGVRIWVQKTDVNGTPQWSQTYGGPNDMGSVIIQTKDGGYVLAGGNGFMYIAKLSSSQTSTFGAYIYVVVVAIVAVIVIMVIAFTIFLKRKRAQKHKEIL